MKNRQVNKQVMKNRQMSMYLQTAIIILMFVLQYIYIYIYSKAQEPPLSAYNGHNLNSGCVFLEILSKGMYLFMYMEIIYSDAVKILVPSGNHDQVVIGKGIFLKRNSTGTYIVISTEFLSKYFIRIV